MNTLFKTVTGDRKADNTDHNIVPLPEKGSVEQSIFIKDLEIEMSIGVLEQEQVKKQRVIINAEFLVSPNIDWRQDDIENVVSYADIVVTIESIAQSKHFNLVETLAEEIIEQCLKVDQINEAKVTIEKPDIISTAGGVGVTIRRTK